MAYNETMKKKKKRIHAPSPQAKQTIADTKKNIDDRLDFLGISAYRAAKSAGKHSTWISDITSADRYSDRMNIAVIVDVAEVLGVPFSALTSSDFDPSAYDVPVWLESEQHE